MRAVRAVRAVEDRNPTGQSVDRLDAVANKSVGVPPATILARSRGSLTAAPTVLDFGSSADLRSFPSGTIMAIPYHGYKVSKPEVTMELWTYWFPCGEW